jgi:serine/threonine protein kinase
MTDYVGQQFGHYRLLRLLGQGAFAAVYLGEHQYLERPAAIKVLHVRMEAAQQEGVLPTRGPHHRAVTASPYHSRL